MSRIYQQHEGASLQTHRHLGLKSGGCCYLTDLPTTAPAQPVLPAAPRTPTFQMLASFPYTTAMLLTLLDLMNCLSVLLSSSDTKPMKELSGV